MKYIELTERERHGDGAPVLVNLEQVTTITPNGSGSHIIFQTARYVFVEESYEEVLRRISEVNDKQFCLDRKPAQHKPINEQKIISAEAIYTGGGIWNYMGQVEDGTFFYAMDDSCYDVLFLDADPVKAGEDAYFPEWQEAHKVGEFCDSANAFTFFKKMYKSIPEREFVDKQRHIEELDDYIDWTKKNN